MATNAQAFKLYAKILTVSGLGYYAYLYNRCRRLKHEYTDADSIESKKDTTRKANVYYGINWGYRSDETIEKTLDTGDVLFFNYDCNSCFSPQDVLKCKMQKWWLKASYEDTENVAFCFRSGPAKLQVVASHFGGDP